MIEQKRKGEIIIREMPAFLHAVVLIFSLGFILLPAFVYSDHHYLTLERIIPNDHNMELNELKNRDRTRHARILQQQQQSSIGGAAVGLYFTRVKLGSPPKEFNVQIDTGSDMLWVNCNTCSGCPQSSELGIELQFFDPGSSFSASPISCMDSVCSSLVHTAEDVCLENSQCSFQFQHGDGSETAGFYVSDLLGFDTVTGNSLLSNSSAPVVFGCSTSNYQSGGLTETHMAVDGILGFGQHDMSIIQQLSSRGITPRVFSHCLDGTGKGGGVLVLGEVVAEGIVYSPLVPSRPHYNLDLQSIALNGLLVPIDPAVFSNGQGTIVDSGTTLAYLPEEVFDPFVNALVAVVQPSVKPLIDKKGNLCFITQTSVSEAFPPVMLYFAGNATMVLKPENYLVQTSGHQGEWCVGFQKGDLLGQRVTILGDLVLKDKIIIYDLARQRIGWVNHDCSQSVNVTLGSAYVKISKGQLNGSRSPKDALYQIIIPIAATAISLFTGF